MLTPRPSTVGAGPVIPASIRTPRNLFRRMTTGDLVEEVPRSPRRRLQRADPLLGGGPGPRPTTIGARGTPHGPKRRRRQPPPGHQPRPTPDTRPRPRP